MILGITLITFSVIHLAPGEPVEMQMAMNPKVGKEARERLNQFYGLARPLHEQYFDWVGKLGRLDRGRSFSSDNSPVR
jgi:peptide/nickel transport system permease protein